jgi:hypothetical protein
MCSQTQGSLKNANQGIESMLNTWLENNHMRKWSEGSCFLHIMKSGVYQRGIKSSPYEAMYGSLKKVGRNTSCLPDETFLNLQTEERPEAGFKSTGDNDENGRHTDKTNNEIMDHIVQQDDNKTPVVTFQKNKADIKGKHSVIMTKR